ncbi:MAG: glycosyltransferase [Candidatus Contendobacter sp.]|nr:glycosyltransferase [Candidatus Contendobacter sp.]MDS4056978.1 glycosyltransferase [Candidatus Contendobacter sp.]
MNHILLITTSYPDESEGAAAAGTFVQDFAQALSATTQVTVIAPGEKTYTRQEHRVQVRRFAVPRQPLSLLSPIHPTHWPVIITTLQAGGRAVRQACETLPITHNLALWALPSGYWAMQAQRRFGVPYSIWALGSDIWTLGKIPIVRGMLRRVLRDAASRYADGLALKADVERIGGKPCAFLPSCRLLADGRVKALRDYPPYRLAFLGRWHPNKGIDLLLQALELLSDGDWQRIEAIYIHGGGPLENQVRIQTTPLIQAGRPVTVGGYLDRDGARELLNWADYVVIPSRIESIPVIFSDAMQMRCPVIAMPVGDLPQLIGEHRCGVLAMTVTAASLAQALRQALTLAPADFAVGLDTVASAFNVVTTARHLAVLLEGTA